MSGNSFGAIFKIMTFGESHGKAVGVVIDGCPSNIALTEADIQIELDKRKPNFFCFNNSNELYEDKLDKTEYFFSLSTTRKEADTCEILSGVFNGVTLGTPIAILIRNTAANKKDYEYLKDIYRPGHADFSYESKFKIRDFYGGGRASGRETAARVAAGAVAKKLLKSMAEQKKISEITVETYAEEIAGIKLACPAKTEKDLPAEVIRKFLKLKTCGDSAGAVIACRIINAPCGLGEPVFSKLEAELSKAMMSIGGVKGMEFGSGFEGAKMTGFENNSKKENSGGIAGGISDGSEIFFRLAVKPVPSISAPQKVIKKNGKEKIMSLKGRYDICLFPRIIPVVEAMVMLTLSDAVLLQTRNKIFD